MQASTSHADVDNGNDGGDAAAVSHCVIAELGFAVAGDVVLIGAGAGGTGA